jgi:hypothetical protein
MENHPEFIDRALEMDFEVEVDLRKIGDKLYLGHDEPEYLVPLSWLEDRSALLWVHCKNKEALELDTLHRFWHDKDDVVYTSYGILWAYPGAQPIKNSIAVLPELNNEFSDYGICTDWPIRYRDSL